MISFLGFILGIVGGALGIAWSPKETTEEDKRVCLKCGKFYSTKYTHCPYCGASPEEKKSKTRN